MKRTSMYRRPLYRHTKKHGKTLAKLRACDQCSLGKGYVGIVFAFIAPAEEKELRMRQIVETMNLLLELGFEAIPRGCVSRFVQRIDNAYERLSEPVLHQFDVSVPLRRVDDFNNVLKWDHHKHEWELATCSTVELTGNNFIIFADDAVEILEHKKTKVKPPTFVKIRRRRRIVRSATTAA